MKLTPHEQALVKKKANPEPRPNGRAKSAFAQACEAAGFSPRTIRDRMARLNISLEEALAIPRATNRESGRLGGTARFKKDLS